MITRAIAQANNVNVRFHQTGHNCAPFQVNHANTRTCLWRAPAHRGKLVVVNRHRIYNAASRVHSVNFSVDKHQRFAGAGILCAGSGSTGEEHHARACLQETAARSRDVALVVVRLFQNFGHCAELYDKIASRRAK